MPRYERKDRDLTRTFAPQEVYWRIPATMCPATLREMVAKLQHKEERQASPTVERRDEMETDPAMRRLEDGSDGLLFFFVTATYFFFPADDGDHRLSIVASDIYDDQLSDHSDHSFHHSVNSDYHNSDEGVVYRLFISHRLYHVY